MGAFPRAGGGREGSEQRRRGTEESRARARPCAGRARALPPQRRPRPPRLSAPAREPGPRAAAAAGGTMSGAARAGPARLAALALLTCSLWPARADNASQEYYTALINVTVQEPGRGSPLTFRIDRGRYGLDSPKAEVRGQVLAPLPIHGGECLAGEREAVAQRRAMVPRPREPQPGSGGGGRGAPTPGLDRRAARRGCPPVEVPVVCTPACSVLGLGSQARFGDLLFFLERLRTFLLVLGGLFTGRH